jgi:hypothetical protein
MIGEDIRDFRPARDGRQNGDGGQGGDGKQDNMAARDHFGAIIGLLSLSFELFRGGITQANGDGMHKIVIGDFEP